MDDRLSAAVASDQVSRTILIAEDDPLLSRMYETKFIKEGFSVVVAKDGEDCVRLALERKPACILCDVMMPRLNGLDAVERIRSTPNGKEIPVVMLSNLTRTEEVARAKTLGVFEYLIKSNTTPKDVVAVVIRALAV